MVDSNIVQLLTSYQLDPENESVRAYFEKDNIWKILDVQRYEPSHSAFLAWFFSQKNAEYIQVRYLLNLLVSLAGQKLIIGTTDKKIFSDAIISGAYSINRDCRLMFSF